MDQPPQAQQSTDDADARQRIARRRLFSIGAITVFGISALARGKPASTPITATATTAAPAARNGAIAPAPAVSSPPVPSASRLRESETWPADRPPIAVGAAPERRRMAPQYFIDDAGPSAIALTLDDGPHPVYTPQVLEILDQYGIQATFNMIGSQVHANLGLVREVAAAGHVITNHTWDHADLRRYTTKQVLSEIDRCNDVLAAAGQTPTIFRAPYGYWTPAVFEACAERGMTPLGWSIDPRDWDTAHVSTSDIVRTVLRKTRHHDIILEHDGGGNRSNTVAALRIFIPALLERGFVFATV